MSEKSDIEASLTPTEELIIDVLVARHRLGEPFWPIAMRHRKSIAALENRGLVNNLGSADGTCLRVGLTLKAKALWARPEKYVPPIFRDDPDKEQEWRKLQFLLFDE